MAKKFSKSQRRLRDALVRVFDELGKEIVGDLKDLLSSPGNRKNRSKEGEPPRRITGNYRGSISYKVKKSDKVELVVFSDKSKYSGNRSPELAKILEVAMNRPHFSTVLRDWSSRAEKFVNERLKRFWR